MTSYDSYDVKLFGSLQLQVFLNLQVGIVSYKQWVDISMELPCSKMERWEYSLLGLTVSADYPKFYPCDFNYNLPLPNEHIPYLRLKNAAKALAV